MGLKKKNTSRKNDKITSKEKKILNVLIEEG